MQRVLGIFAKEPRPGLAKTRLAAALGPETAARLADTFLRDLLDRVVAVDARRVLAFSPPESRPFFTGLACGRFELRDQVGSDLGERMSEFFSAQFRSGGGPVILIGSDLPHLPVWQIEYAFAELTRRELVVGPCDDGGYYLIGMSRMIPDVFESIIWSRPDVFLQTIRRVEKLPVRLTLLERSFDIDRPEDVTKLAAELAVARRAGRDPGLPHTEKALESAVSRVGGLSAVTSMKG